MHKSKIIEYRDFNYFDDDSFTADFLQELSIQNIHSGEFEKFKHIFSEVLNTNVPIKEKNVRGNQSPFMNKQLRKAILTQTCFHYKYRK